MTSPKNVEVVRFCQDGKVFWKGREVESDADFRAAMMDMHKALRSSLNGAKKNKKYDPAQVSDTILSLSDDAVGPITNLKLQKLLYYSQAWHLALYGKPLFDEDFEAWVNGPILPSQYRRFKDFAGEPISRRSFFNFRRIGKLPKALVAHVGEVLRAYGDLSGFDLAVLSHSEPPMLEARQGLPPDATSNAIISKESMTRFFQTKKGIFVER